ncbi:7358_t:CDS:2, partial [Cetraspora pellucida]
MSALRCRGNVELSDNLFRSLITCRDEIPENRDLSNEQPYSLKALHELLNSRLWSASVAIVTLKISLWNW